MKSQIATRTHARTTLAIATFAVAASAGVTLATTASADGRRPHNPYVAQTFTYRPMEGFSRVVADKRFTGFFTAARGACSVSLILSQADDEALRTPIQRIRFELGATQVADIAANDREALGIACSVDADALEVAALSRTRTRTVARD